MSYKAICLFSSNYSSVKATLPQIACALLRQIPTKREGMFPLLLCLETTQILSRILEVS